jgi:hypothetical protein
METVDNSKFSNGFEVRPKDGDPIGAIGHWEFEPPASLSNSEDSSGFDHDLTEEVM